MISRLDTDPSGLVMGIILILSLLSTVNAIRLHKNRDEKTLGVHGLVGSLLLLPVDFLITLFAVVLLSSTTGEEPFKIGLAAWLLLVVIINLPVIVSQIAYIRLKNYSILYLIIPFLPVVNIIFMIFSLLRRRRNVSRET
ncbi:MAG: hypothetical protein K5648_00100 [Erysipelotrichaceae bacterium]|nr:hypothetical protein [Erysipelotrichaceae bacterium]